MSFNLTRFAGLCRITELEHDARAITDTDHDRDYPKAADAFRAMVRDSLDYEDPKTALIELFKLSPTTDRLEDLAELQAILAAAAAA